MCQSLVSANGTGLGGNMAELLRRSVLYVKPVDPAMWCGALRKCEDRILPCLSVRQALHSVSVVI